MIKSMGVTRMRLQSQASACCSSSYIVSEISRSWVLLQGGFQIPHVVGNEAIHDVNVCAPVDMVNPAIQSDILAENDLLLYPDASEV